MTTIPQGDPGGVPSAGTPPSRPEDEVVELCRDLIRIDTSNYGEQPGPGERKAAEYVAEKLDEVGLDVELVESEPGRASVITRIPGTGEGRDELAEGALLLHGHLDVVPADAADWQVDPFAAEVRDGAVWGRGAVDMKDMDAMILAMVRAWRRTGFQPSRDVVVAFLADEEHGGRKGSHWLVEHRPDLFEGCTDAVSEVGGFSVALPRDRRMYLIQTAEKGIAWMRLTARGRAGHGSMVNAENAVTAIAAAVARVGAYTWPPRRTGTVDAFLRHVREALELPASVDDEELLGHLGPVAGLVGTTLRNSANPTMLGAGYKVNVIPGTATAHIDGRFLPGLEEEFFATVDDLLGPGVTREFVNHDVALETPFAGPTVAAMTAALRAEDPGALAVPYCLSAGTDNKAFSLLGIRGYGFAPLRLPPDLDFAAMFHGVDERVPIDALRFGARVLDRFARSC